MKLAALRLWREREVSTSPHFRALPYQTLHSAVIAACSHDLLSIPKLVCLYQARLPRASISSLPVSTMLNPHPCADPFTRCLARTNVPNRPALMLQHPIVCRYLTICRPLHRIQVDSLASVTLNPAYVRPPWLP